MIILEVDIDDNPIRQLTTLEVDNYSLPIFGVQYFVSQQLIEER